MPYAGANRYAYKVLENEFPSSIIIHPLELPGRGMRFTEKLLTSLDAAVEDIYMQMSPFLQSPYAIFGHSLGAVLGYLVTRKILSYNIHPPFHLFCSGRSGLWNENPQAWYLLPSVEFWGKISGLGGLPEPLSMNDEIKIIFEPILRADFEMVQSVEQKKHLMAVPMGIPVTVFLGEDDRITNEPSSWHKYTIEAPVLHYFRGGHFFFLENQRRLVQLILETLQETMYKSYQWNDEQPF